jgi:hypothetical protein
VPIWQAGHGQTGQPRRFHLGASRRNEASIWMRKSRQLPQELPAGACTGSRSYHADDGCIGDCARAMSLLVPEKASKVRLLGDPARSPCTAGYKVGNLPTRTELQAVPLGPFGACHGSFRRHTSQCCITPAQAQAPLGCLAALTRMMVVFRLQIC